MVDCNICYCTYKDEECYTLPNCLHQFCKACLSEQLKTKIEAQQIDLSDFKCPKCGLLFNPEIIENFLSPNLFQKYCDFALQFNKIMGLEDHELLTNCLNEKCIEKFIIWKDAEYMQCPSCKMKFCRNCSLKYHRDEGITCEQQKKLLRDSFYMEMKKNVQICKCPKCNNMCEKISGCNFMYCRCKANFCFLCDVELTEENHYKHWQNDDPFKSPCRAWYNGTWVDPDKVPKVEPIKEEKIVQVIPIEEKEKENKIPCPNCGTKKKDESQLVFFDQVIQCILHFLLEVITCLRHQVTLIKRHYFAYLNEYFKDIENLMVNIFQYIYSIILSSRYCLNSYKLCKENQDQLIRIMFLQNQMVDCNICYCTYKEEECYTLPNCLHQFCKACLSEQLKTKIEAQQIDLSDFKCPQCGRLFNPEIIENFLSPNLFQKYCDFALQFNKIMGLEDHELLTNCLNEKCIEKFIIWKDAEYMQCPSCKMKFCRKCQLDFHADKGVSCEQQKELHKDQFYMEMKKNFKICKCPKCNNMCEKISGCNFMYCRCKANFCFLCDVELTEQYHSSHFQNNDACNSPCRVWYNGTWVDPDKVPKVEPIKEEKIVQVIPIEEKEKENKIPCPNCGNKNKVVSQLVFFDKVIQCQSVKCQNQAFCISCQKKMPIDDMISHFNKQTLLCKFK